MLIWCSTNFPIRHYLEGPCDSVQRENPLPRLKIPTLRQNCYFPTENGRKVVLITPHSRSNTKVKYPLFSYAQYTQIMCVCLCGGGGKTFNDLCIIMGFWICMSTLKLVPKYPAPFDVWIKVSIRTLTATVTSNLMQKNIYI